MSNMQSAWQVILQASDDELRESILHLPTRQQHRVAFLTLQCTTAGMYHAEYCDASWRDTVLHQWEDLPASAYAATAPTPAESMQAPPHVDNGASADDDMPPPPWPESMTATQTAGPEPQQTASSSAADGVQQLSQLLTNLLQQQQQQQQSQPRPQQQPRQAWADIQDTAPQPKQQSTAKEPPGKKPPPKLPDHIHGPNPQQSPQHTRTTAQHLSAAAQPARPTAFTAAAAISTANGFDAKRLRRQLRSRTANPTARLPQAPTARLFSARVRTCTSKPLQPQNLFYCPGQTLVPQPQKGDTALRYSLQRTRLQLRRSRALQLPTARPL